jgi:hypothetical protein
MEYTSINEGKDKEKVGKVRCVGGTFFGAGGLHHVTGPQILMLRRCLYNLTLGSCVLSIPEPTGNLNFFHSFILDLCVCVMVTSSSRSHMSATFPANGPNQTAELIGHYRLKEISSSS